MSEEALATKESAEVGEAMAMAMKGSSGYGGKLWLWREALAMKGSYGY